MTKTTFNDEDRESPVSYKKKNFIKSASNQKTSRKDFVKKAQNPRKDRENEDKSLKNNEKKEKNEKNIRNSKKSTELFKESFERIETLKEKDDFPLDFK